MNTFTVFIRAVLIVPILYCSLAQAGEIVPEDARVSRYGYVTPDATPEQRDPLSVVVKVSFNSHIATVGEALDHLLLRSGYQMASLEASDPSMRILVSRDLPEVHRKLGPITLVNALKALSGPVWELIVDPVNRLISFDLNQEYRSTAVVSSAPMPNNTVVADVSAKGE